MTGRTKDLYVKALNLFKSEIDKKVPSQELSTKKSKSSRRSTTFSTLKWTDPCSTLPYFNNLLVDFELAQENAFTEVFKGVPHSCFFHFRQALQRKLNTLTNLSERVKTDTSQAFKIAFNSFVTLALI